MVGLHLLVSMASATVSGALPHASSSLSRSRVFRLRGGSASTLAAPPSTEAVKLRLSVMADRSPPSTAAGEPRKVPPVGLASAELDLLKLKPGDRVLLTKVKKSPWFAPSPDELVGEVTEDIKAREGSVRVPVGVMQAVNLRAGDGVVVTASTEAEAGTRQPMTYHHRRHYNPWMRMLIWQTMFGGRRSYGYGYGHGHGGFGGYGHGYGQGFGGRRGHYGGKRSTFGMSGGGRRRR